MPTNINTPFDPLLDKVLIEDSVTGETQARPFPEIAAAAPVSTATQTALDLKQNLSEKAQPDGYASLGANGKVPASQLPNPASQINSDWNQTSTISPAYIQNKPVNATTLTDGFLSAADKVKIDNMPADVSADLLLKEDKVNKKQDLNTPNATDYPSTQAVFDALAANRQSADGVSIKGTGFSPNPFEINYPTQAQVLIGADASKAINSALLKAKTDTVLPKDIVSGAVVGTNLILTLQDGTTLPNIDVTTLANVPDVKLQSGVYNTATKALDFTLSNGDVVSVPVTDLLPINTANSIVGNGSTTVVELRNDLTTPGNNKVYGTNAIGIKGWNNQSKSEVNAAFGTVTDTNPDGTTTNAVANWGNLTNYPTPIAQDSLYITDTTNNKNHVIRIDDLKIAMSPKISGADLTGTQNEVIALSNAAGNKQIAIEKKDIIIDVDGLLDFTKGLNVNYSITQTVTTIDLPLTSNYQTLITDPNFANDRTGELIFSNLTGNTVMLRTQTPDEIGISGNSKLFLDRGESAILGIVFNQLGTFGSNSSGYKVLADKKNATTPAPLSNIAYTSQATATVLQTDASTINVQIPIDILNTATPVGTDKIAFVNSSGIHRKVDLTNLPMTTAQNTINIAQTATNTAQTATNTSQASINTTQATTNSTQATINTTQTATNTAQATTNANTITALSLKEDKANKGVAGGYAGLDAGGKIPVTQLPALAITDTSVVANQAAMLALTAETGDLAVRTDLNKTFILKALPSTTLANWQELLTPTSAVTSVNGQVGAVSLTKTDVGLGNVDNTTDLNKPLSTPAIAALALKQDKSSFAVPSIVLGSTTVSQKILITDQASTATNSIDVDSLFSVFPTKDTLGKIILPVVTNNDFFRSGSGATLPDGLTDTTENVSRLGRIGVNVSDPSQVISTVDNFGSQGFPVTETSAVTYAATDTDYTITLTASTLQTITLMSASSATRREYVIVNNAAVSKALSQPYTRFDGVTTTTIPARSSITIQSNGSLWRQIQGESTNGLKSKRITQPLIVGNNVITHNMALVAPFFVELTVRNAATGAVITVRKVPATEGSNTVTVNTGTAIASAEINIIQINA